MILFCRAHTGNIHESLLIRLPNRNLVEALFRKTAEVGAALAEARHANLANRNCLPPPATTGASRSCAELFAASLGSIDLDGEMRAVADHIRDSVDAMEPIVALFDRLTRSPTALAGRGGVLRALLRLDALSDPAIRKTDASGSTLLSRPSRR